VSGTHGGYTARMHAAAIPSLPAGPAGAHAVVCKSKPQQLV